MDSSLVPKFYLSLDTGQWLIAQDESFAGHTPFMLGTVNV